MCGKEVNGTSEHNFSQQKGGLICLECFKEAPNSLRLSGGTIKMLQRAQTIELSKVKRLYFSPQARTESRKILPYFIETRIEKPLKSLKFIEHLNEEPS
jgi:recombinational DNA repair protein (RecF pathway)